MESIHFSVSVSSKLLIAVPKESNVIQILDSNSLNPVKTYKDNNNIDPKCIAIASNFHTFITYSLSKTIFSYWTFDSVL